MDDNILSAVYKACSESVDGGEPSVIMGVFGKCNFCGRESDNCIQYRICDSCARETGVKYVMVCRACSCFFSRAFLAIAFDVSMKVAKELIGFILDSRRAGVARVIALNQEQAEELLKHIDAGVAGGAEKSGEKKKASYDINYVG